MTRKADLIKGYLGPNPFKDHQARTFDGEKIVNEFYPTTTFWSLFNDQHEILIGRRGSGKTILLKMMKYSLLKRMNTPEAKELINEKKYVGIFVSTHLEFIGSFQHQKIPDLDKRDYFQFAFNCFIARSFLHELNSIISNEEDSLERAFIAREVAQTIGSVWFPKSKKEKFRALGDLDSEINNLYENLDFVQGFDNIPRVFRNTICRPIQVVSSLIYEKIGFNNEPTWLVCIDEAEFIPADLQRCINSLFRAESRGVVIKMATMPYAHETTETLSNGIFAESNGNDFIYRKIDMENDSDDFINVTNSLIKTRLSYLKHIDLSQIVSLDEFVEKVGNDDQIDYYRREISKRNISEKDFQIILKKNIIESLSDERQKTAMKHKEQKKSIQKIFFDKFSPIFFTRKMHKLSKKGNRIPGWYAGPKMIRKISQGNPRQFILIMNSLFERSRSRSLTPKAQHDVIMKYLKQFSQATKALPIYGPSLFDIIENLSKQLFTKAHNESFMVYAGNSFMLHKNVSLEDEHFLRCLKLGVGYLRIDVDDDSYISKIDSETKFSISNSLSALNWLPMRKGDYPRLYTSLQYKQKKLDFNDQNA